MSNTQHKSNHPPIRAVLFDLDDTLFDHRHSSRSGLAALQQNYRCLRQKTLDELEQDYLRLLNELHPRVLSGELSLEEARLERIRQFFSQYGEHISASTVEAVTARYHHAYNSVRRPVPFVISLLEKLRSQVKIGVVSNNLLAEQKRKLHHCGLEPFIDVLIVSEEVGVTKPHPAIFQEALARSSCRAEQAVMVGDSWSEDILGAHKVGMRAVWLNRYGAPCPDPTLATEISSFDPPAAIMDLLLMG